MLTMIINQIITLDGFENKGIAMNLLEGNDIYVLISLWELNMRKNINPIRLSTILDKLFFIEFLCGLMRKGKKLPCYNGNVNYCTECGTVIGHPLSDCKPEKCYRIIKDLIRK